MVQALRNDSDYLKEVREQYENYPYPPRNPENERRAIVYPYANLLDCICYYGFAGMQNFENDFRALVAGGGTGDAAIVLAEQLRDYDAEIVYLDISDASMQVAQQRAEVRRLHNIKWVHGSILDASKLGLGKFDFIDCNGVLHHLESPNDGLKQLHSVLKEDGVLSIMLYALYGRHRIYQMQELMHNINRCEVNLQHRVNNCKKVLEGFSDDSGLKEVLGSADLVNGYGDVGIYDLLLHSNDVAYTIAGVYDFLDCSGLKMQHLFFENERQGNGLYDPNTYLTRSDAKCLFKELSPKEKYIAAELLHGNMKKHSFYAKNTVSAVPDVTNINMVPALCVSVFSDQSYSKIYEAVRNIKQGELIKCNVGVGDVVLCKTANMELIFKYLDGVRSIGEIFDKVKEHYEGEKKPSNAELAGEFKIIFDAFVFFDRMFLRDRSVKGFSYLNDLQKKVADMYK